MKTSDLFESLQIGDLVGMISPVISIDEFEPKIIDDAIVVTFKTTEKDAGSDLSFFISKNPVDIIDAEVSDVSNNDDEFSVYIEFERNKDLVPELMALILDISHLAGMDKEAWKFSSYHEKEIFKLDHENITKHIRLTSVEKQDQEQIDSWTKL